MSSIPNKVNVEQTTAVSGAAGTGDQGSAVGGGPGGGAGRERERRPEARSDSVLISSEARALLEAEESEEETDAAPREVTAEESV